MKQIRFVAALLAAWAGLSPHGSAAYAEAQTQFQLLRINGHYMRWFPNTAGKIVVRYAVADRRTETPGAVNCGRIDKPSRILASSSASLDDLRATIATSFAAWASVANISFVETAPENAQLLIGEQTDPVGHAFTNIVAGNRTEGAYREIAKASICLNPQQRWKSGKDGDARIYDLAHTLAHEIGHAIGLDHPGPRGPLMAFRYDETLRGLASGDIAGAVLIYGKREERIEDALLNIRAGALQ